jgi:class 3 adenylate cyclase
LKLNEKSTLAMHPRVEANMSDRLTENDIVALLVDIPERRLHRGDIGTVIDVVAPTTGDSYILLEFGNGVQTDLDDVADIIKLNSHPKALVVISHKQTLQEWAGKSRIFALVFTDIVDSSALANQLGDERWIDLLQKHFGKARDLMANYDCHEIKIIGDSFMVIFRSACEALDFSLALNEEPGDKRIKIRAGIHVGSARIVDNDILGNMVNYTKRVESVQSPVSVKLSDAAMRQVADEKAQRHSCLRYAKVLEVFKGFGEQPIWTAEAEAQTRKPQRARSVTNVNVIGELSFEEANVARKLLAWSNHHFSRVTWKGASFVPVLDYGGSFSHNPITVYCRGKVARVGIKFGRMKNRNQLPDEKRMELLLRLNSIPGVNLPTDCIDRFPSIPFSTLASADSLDQFKAAIVWTIEQVKTMPPQPTGQES